MKDEEHENKKRRASENKGSLSPPHRSSNPPVPTHTPHKDTEAGMLHQCQRSINSLVPSDGLPLFPSTSCHLSFLGVPQPSLRRPPPHLTLMMALKSPGRAQSSTPAAPPTQTSEPRTVKLRTTDPEAQQRFPLKDSNHHVHHVLFRSERAHLGHVHSIYRCPHISLNMDLRL